MCKIDGRGNNNSSDFLFMLLYRACHDMGIVLKRVSRGMINLCCLVINDVLIKLPSYIYNNHHAFINNAYYTQS